MKARPANDFAAVQPVLERTLDLSRQLSGFTPNSQHVADPLIDRQDPGMTASQVSALFAELRARLVPLLRRIAAAGGNDDFRPSAGAFP